MKTEKTIAWSVNRAAIEFGCDRTTLRKRLADAGQQPDRKGQFSTRQVCAALFGDAHAVKVRSRLPAPRPPNWTYGSGRER